MKKVVREGWEDNVFTIIPNDRIVKITHEKDHDNEITTCAPFLFDGKYEHISIELGEEFYRNAIVLTDKFEWIIGKDCDDTILLIPLKKKR